MSNVKLQTLPYYIGYLKDPKDTRDYTLEMFDDPTKFTPLINSNSTQERLKQEEVKLNRRFSQAITEKFNINDTPLEQLQPKYDIIKFLTKIRNQLSLGSCTAFAASSIVEYINSIINGVTFQMSTLYTYKLTRNLMRLFDGFTDTGDTGAFLRSTMRSLAMYGFVTEKEYPYNIKEFDNPISEELKEVGNFYKALRYLRVDHKGIRNDRQAVVNDLKKWAWFEVPIIFGFTCWESCLAQANNSNTRGKIPFPDPNALRNEQPSGGHAITIVGYDDNMIINNFSKDRTRLLSKTKGAFIIRNSWSNGWGNVLAEDNKNYGGYGYFPYEYVMKGLANDFWVLLSQEFLDLKQFED
jgi:C1A family cysteine protease